MKPPYARRKVPWQRSTARVAIFVAVAVLALVALVVRLVQVQIVHGAQYRAAAQANQVRLIPVAAPRGIIYARDGTVLARSRPSFVVALIPSEVMNVTSELATIAATIGVPQQDLRSALLHHRGIDYKNFDEVAADEPYGPVILSRNLTVAQVAKIAELQSDLPGVDLEAQPVRNYPHGPLASHLLGYVGAISAQEYERRKNEGYSPNDVVGKDGLEYEYDRVLRGIPGGRRIVVDAQNQVVPSVKLPPKPSVPGDSLVTSIDWRLQVIVERALAAGIKRVAYGRTLSGAAVAEDPHTGAILALASYPNYDPNAFASGDYKKIERYLTDPAEPLYDDAIAAATPTGSTVKMITGSAALTEGVVRVNQVVYDTGEWNCGGYIARDIAAGGLGNTTFVPALAASSDGYFYRLSWWLGRDRLRKFALAFGLDHRTGIDLPGEIAGNWPTDAWMDANYGNVCFLGIGQGAMQATPLQMANVASTVINGGTLYRPRIVWQIRDPQGRVVKRFAPAPIRHVPATPQALAAVRAGMAKVTDPGGTAYGLAIAGLPFSGKTGTAETGVGGSGANTTWFIAWAPTGHPKFALAVFVSRSGGYGATVAAPIARQILVDYFHKK